MHENLLHICQDIRRNGEDDEESSDEVPRDIHVKRMLVSKVTPKMSLSKYLALTMDKHGRDPDGYEKEACLILLQILKGLGHLGSHGLMVQNIDSESVLLSDMHRGVMSPNLSDHLNNNVEVLGCPIAMYLALPGFLEGLTKVKGEECNKGEEAKGDSSSISRSDTTPLESADQKSNVKSFAGIDGIAKTKLSKERCKELIVLIFDIFHASHLLDDGIDSGIKSMPLEMPKIPVKSVYSSRLQEVIDELLNCETVSIHRLIRKFQVLSFCPFLMEQRNRDEIHLVWNKWRNRRCVDMVTDILKKYSLISLASGLASGGTNSMGLARNCVLECQFLSNVSAEELTAILCGKDD